MAKKLPEIDEWPDVISDIDEESYPIYTQICDAVGDLTAAILEAKMHGIFTPSVANAVYYFLENVQESLEEHMEES